MEQGLNGGLQESLQDYELFIVAHNNLRKALFHNGKPDSSWSSFRQGVSDSRAGSLYSP
jgi:hypothetical protein